MDILWTIIEIILGAAILFYFVGLAFGWGEDTASAQRYRKHQTLKALAIVIPIAGIIGLVAMSYVLHDTVSTTTLVLGLITGMGGLYWMSHLLDSKKISKGRGTLLFILFFAVSVISGMALIA